MGHRVPLLRTVYNKNLLSSYGFRYLVSIRYTSVERVRKICLYVVKEEWWRTLHILRIFIFVRKKFPLENSSEPYFYSFNINFLVFPFLHVTILSINHLHKFGIFISFHDTILFSIFIVVIISFIFNISVVIENDKWYILVIRFTKYILWSKSGVLVESEGDWNMFQSYFIYFVTLP